MFRDMMNCNGKLLKYEKEIIKGMKMLADAADATRSDCHQIK